jgi:hypothetical protein
MQYKPKHKGHTTALFSSAILTSIKLNSSSYFTGSSTVSEHPRQADERLFISTNLSSWFLSTGEFKNYSAAI